MNPLDMLTEIEAKHEQRSRELTRVLSAAAYTPSLPLPSRWAQLLKRLKGETNGHDR